MQSANAHNTIVPQLISVYLERIPDERDLLNYAVVRKLTGLLSIDVSVKESKRHIEEKYGGR